MRKRKEKKKKRTIAPILSTRGTNESIHEKREIPRSSFDGGDAVGPTGSLGGPSVSFGALVARPRVYRIEDLRRFSESFVHPRTGSRGFSRALSTIAQYTAWQPGPRVVHNLHRRRMERVDAVLACLRERTRKRARSLERAPFCVFGKRTRSSCTTSARGTWSTRVATSIPNHVRGHLFARGDPISSTSVARARHATARSRSAGKRLSSASIEIGLEVYVHHVVIS